MKIEVEIDDEMLDEAFRQNLIWHIKHCEKELKNLRSKKKLKEHQIRDKEHFEKLYPALKIVGEYFGVK